MQSLTLEQKQYNGIHLKHMLETLAYEILCYQKKQNPATNAAQIPIMNALTQITPMIKELTSYNAEHKLAVEQETKQYLDTLAYEVLFYCRSKVNPRTNAAQIPIKNAATKIILLIERLRATGEY